MQRSFSAGRLSVVAGVVTWLLVTGFAFSLAYRSDALADRLPLGAILALVNGVAMAWLFGNDRSQRRLALTAYWLQLGAALAMGWLLPISFLPIYTIIWIAMAPAFYSFRVCLLLLAAVLVAWFLIMSLSWREEAALFTTLLYGTFHLFALLSARNAAEAETARRKAEALARELLATQHLLSEASRQGERTRIARELHDLLGHHLTALSLNLQIAERLAEGDVRERIEASRALARLLLSDVRDAVTTLRDDGALDLVGALELLAANVPELDVDVDIEEGLIVDDIEIAESLLRCAQESITNTLKHAGASRSRIRLWREGESLCLEAVDDGRAKRSIAEGHGITGMRERLAALGGSLRLDTVEDSLRVSVRIPVRA